MKKFWLVWKVGGNCPMVMHESNLAAEREAEQLAQKNIGAVFYVLEAVAALQCEPPAPKRVLLAVRP